MGARLYGALVRLHPREFRERFGDEMVRVFEDERSARARVLLLVDAAASVARQRVLRGAPGPAPAVAAVEGAPMFQVIESAGPRRSALFQGAVLSLLVFAFVGFAAARGGVGAKWRGVLIGSKHPRPQVLGVDRSSIAGADAFGEISVASPAVDPLEPVARAYFNIVRVLDVLDADQDRIISAREMAAAGKALARLDRDHDGRLSPDECGFSLGDVGGRLPKEQREGAAITFMRSNPVLAALDRDGDGVISAEEISAGATTLRSLDRNGDGALSPFEVLPDGVATQAAIVLVRLDRNRDGRISPEELASYDGQEFRGLLDRADRDGDGYVTAAELSRELRLAAEAAKQLNAAVRANRAR